MGREFITAQLAPKKSNKKLLIIIGSSLAGLCVICLLAAVIGNIFNPTTSPAGQPTLDTAAIYTAAAQTALAQLPAPTQFPPPTQAPAPVEPTATTAPTLFKVGDRIDQGGFAMTVTQAETAQQYGIWTADSGKKYVAVEVLFESNADTGVNVNPLYFDVKDSDGYQYNSSLMGKDPALQSENDLPKGQKMRGWLTFEVSEGAHGLMLTFKPIQFFNTTRLSIDLGL